MEAKPTIGQLLTFERAIDVLEAAKASEEMDKGIEFLRYREFKGDRPMTSAFKIQGKSKGRFRI